MSTEAQTVTYRCTACGTLNRLPVDRVAGDPKCGKCGDKVFPRQPVAVTDATWAAVVESSPLPVLVDVWAPWCGPCKMVAPVIDKVAAERAGRVVVAKLLSDDNQQTARRFNIQSIPTLLLFDRGRLVSQQSGAVSKQDLDAWMARSLS